MESTGEQSVVGNVGGDAYFGFGLGEGVLEVVVKVGGGGGERDRMILITTPLGFHHQDLAPGPRRLHLPALYLLLLYIDLPDQLVEIVEVQTCGALLAILANSLANRLVPTQVPELVFCVLFVLTEIFDVFDEFHSVVVQALYVTLLFYFGGGANDFHEVVGEGTFLSLVLGLVKISSLTIPKALLKHILPQSIKQLLPGNSPVLPGRNIVRILQQLCQLLLDCQELLDGFFSIQATHHLLVFGSVLIALYSGSVALHLDVYAFELHVFEAGF